MPRPRKTKPRSPELGALGKAIELIRKRSGMTRELVASDAGLDARQIGAYVGGQGNPTFDTLQKVSKGLHVRPAELVLRAQALQELDSDGGAQPPLTRAAEPRVVWMPGGVRTEVHVSAHDSGGAFCMLIDEPPAGWLLPAHLHHNEAETIHVLDGEFQMEVDGQPSRLSPGQTIHIPQGTVHSSANVGLGAGRRALIFSPGGMERFFLEAGTPLPGEAIDQAGALACAMRHGWEFIGAS